MRSLGSTNDMAKKPRQEERQEHFDRQDKPRLGVRKIERPVSMQKSKLDEAHNDGVRTLGLVQEDIEYPFIEVMPMALALHLDEKRPPIWLDAETGMVLGEILQEASLQCLLCEYDA